MAGAGGHEVPVLPPSLGQTGAPQAGKQRREAAADRGALAEAAPLRPRGALSALGSDWTQEHEGQDVEPMGAPPLGRLRADWSEAAKGGGVPRWRPREDSESHPAARQVRGRRGLPRPRGEGRSRLGSRFPRDRQALARRRARVTNRRAQPEL